MNATATKTKFQAKVTGRHAITLPPELSFQLDVKPGDVVELEIVGDTALIRKQPNESVPEEPRKPAPELRGLLSDYFTDREDVQRFIEEERRGWEDREARLEEATKRSMGRSDTSTES